MNESLKLLLSLSLSGSILAIFIFAIKPFISHKFSKSLQYYIWIIVLLRFILPFSFDENIMDKILYKDEIQVNTNVQVETKSFKLPVENGSNSTKSPNSENRLSKKENHDMDHDHSRYFNDLLNKYALIIWFVGVAVAMGFNLIGYFHFIKYLKIKNIPALDVEKNILIDLMGGKDNIKLFRNQFVPTPMLIGIINPHIIIPDNKYNEKQIKNILLHEVAHYKRFDIIIKWITMIITSIHWFNPLIYIIRKEINHSCELACDEFVIKKLKPSERQEYGDTLITVVAEAKYPVGVLQATMSENKSGLKSRLVAIMGYKKKSKVIIALSIVLVIGLIFGAMKLGAGRTYSEPKPPELYIGVKDENTKTGNAILGSYNWRYKNDYIQGDAIDPLEMEYGSGNTVTISDVNEVFISTQNSKPNKKYNFTIDNIYVYKDGELVDINIEPNYSDGSAYILTPTESGEYIYVMDLNFSDRGTATYGFVVKVAQGESDEEKEIVTVTFEDDSELPEEYREVFSNHMINIFVPAYTPYYQMKGFKVSDLRYYEDDIGIEFEFIFTMVHQNYYKDPDTVDYIKEAKENNSKNYQQLYDEYNQPQEGNFYLKFTANIINGQIDENSIQVFTNISPVGVEYVPFNVEDYIIH